MDVFGKEFDYKEIAEVYGAFFETAYLMSEVRDVVAYLLDRREWERQNPKESLNEYQQPPYFILERQRNPDSLNERLTSARKAIDYYRDALHVAEYGPLYNEFFHIDIRCRTEFDRMADSIEPIVRSLVEAKDPRWEPDKEEEWNALTLEERDATMHPMMMAARQTKWESPIRDEPRWKIETMWNWARIADRLIKSLGPAHRSLLDGSLIIARLGYLAHNSPEYGPVESSYPKADRFPIELDAAQWKEFASLIAQLRDNAHANGFSDKTVVEVLCAAEHLAETAHHYASNEWDQEAVDRTDALDRRQYKTVYTNLRNSISDKLFGLLPNRGEIWAEHFGDLAGRVSVQDQAKLKGVLPSQIKAENTGDNDARLYHAKLAGIIKPDPPNGDSLAGDQEAASIQPETTCIADAVQKFGVDKGTVRRWCAAGLIPGATKDAEENWLIPANAERPKMHRSPKAITKATPAAPVVMIEYECDPKWGCGHVMSAPATKKLPVCKCGKPMLRKALPPRPASLTPSVPQT